MSPHRPPILLERALQLALRNRDRDTIAGDLLEIYVEEKLPHLGPRRANLWYIHQLLSIVGRRILRGILMKTAWIIFSTFLVFAGSWLAVMEIQLRHPGFLPRCAVATLIVLYAALSLVFTQRPSTLLRRTIALGAIAAIAFGASALRTGLHSTHFEGYILLIALGLIIQGILTLTNILHHPHLRSA